MDKISKEMIKKLKKEEKYNEIFMGFGQKAYKKYTPKKYQREELHRLSQERRFEDIYNKYGESLYDTISIKAMYDEIKEEKGTIKAMLWKVEQKVLYFAKQIGFSTAFSLMALTTGMPAVSDLEKNDNAIKYESEINEYNRNISEYAKEVRAMHLNDTQVFMKVMYDMWENIQGYAKPDKDIRGFSELDLATNDGYGVCRNMASDVAKKLNEINPDYNARTMVVKLGEDGNYQIANIERKILEENETVTNGDEQRNEETSTDKVIEKIIPEIFGNHMVTVVDISKYNLTLVLDPTNTGIGVYKNDEITMLNSGKENGLEFDVKTTSNILLNTYGYSELINNSVATIKSYLKPNISMEEIEEKFGVEAQNKALQEVQEMMKKENLEISTMTENSKAADKFREELKVDISTKTPQITRNNEQKHEKIQNEDMEK